MTQFAGVIIAGAGCSGLVAALELARQGVPVRLVDRAPRPHTESRGAGLQPRTLELLDIHGVTEEIIALGHEAARRTWPQY